MKNFLRNTKGAVTVFVTLLLVPAILISGTAVDIARIHTARSIIQDANQLAANSILTQYNALLQNLYGIFGIAKNDPILAQLLDEYIRVSVFGEDNQDKSMGTLQLFYGSDIYIEELRFSEGKNLRNPDVLSRQIEEYMKFRGPVIIVEQLLDLLGSSSFKEDTGVIDNKLDIDDTIARIHEKYKELFDLISIADRCDQVGSGIAGYTVGTVSADLDRLRVQFADLKKCYEDWERAGTGERKDDYAAKYRAILVNIKSCTVGGSVGTNWNNGRWTGSSSRQGLNKTIANAKINVDRFKVHFDDVVRVARQIDSMKAELSRKIDALETRVRDGDCNLELKEALTGIPEGSDKSLIETYRDILKWDNIEAMAKTFRDGGYSYIDVTVKDLLEGVIYRNRNKLSDTSLTRTQLENAQTNVLLALSQGVSAENSPVATLGGYTTDNVTYKVPAGFIKFGDYQGRNKDFYEELKQIANQPDVPPVSLFDGQEEAGGGDSEAKQRSMISELTGLVDTAYSGMLNDPLGANYIDNSSLDSLSGDDNKSGIDISESVSQAQNHPVSDVISNPYNHVAAAGDYLLLLTYCTSMFSNYTTARPEITGKTMEDIYGISFPKSVSGVPISPEVNYFFQSEWEYLYNGNENAGKNLSAVSRLIYLVRVVCNYITVFSVTGVTLIVNAIRLGFAWCPALGLVLGELARAAFVAAESAIDLANLRAGYKVPLIKSKSQWVCGPSGVTKALTNALTDTVSANDKTNDEGITYSNYLMFFFITKGVTGFSGSAELIERTANLIEWNVINYSNNIFCDEEKMTEALASADRFRLEDMKTDFSITTTVDMRMLFLSMVFAQNFSDSRGLGIPNTMPVVVTDHRGY